MSASAQNLNEESAADEKGAGIFSPQRRSTLFIFISSFFFWAAIYFYAPVLPTYAESMGASLTMVGVIGAAYALPQLIFRIPAGIWSDSLGRRKPLIIGGILLVLLGAVGLRVSPNPWSLSLSRGLAGIGAASWVVFIVYTVSFYPENKTIHVVGILNFVLNGALTVTTAIGGLVADVWGERSAFLTAAILAFVALLPLLFTREYQTPKTQGFSWRDFGQVTRRPLLIAVSIMGILVFFAEFATVFGFIPIYAAGIGASDTELGILVMLAMGVSMVGSLVVAPMVQRWGHVFTLVLGSIMLGLSLLAVPFIDSIALLDVTQVLNGMGWGMLSTQLMALSIYDTTPRWRATAMGFFQAVYAIGMLTGPLVSGLLANSFGLAVIFYFSSAVCLVVIGMAYLPFLPRQQS
jgi:DHA1 family multidrug resistance protein-like MFS transporter